MRTLGLVALATLVLAAGATSRTAAVAPASALAASQDATCALTGNGSVKCWGYFFGDSFSRVLSAVDIPGLSDVISIAAGGDHACAVTEDGAAACWGQNPDGVLGDGTTTDSRTPVAVVGLGGPVTAISTTFSNSCALTAAGGVKCWGQSGLGRLGDGTTNDRLTPVDVKGLSSGVAAIAAGGTHTCALTAAGAVKCWGANTYGQLGNGGNAASPVPVDVAGLQRGVVEIDAGAVFTCALTAGGGVKCWGDNVFGELGTGSLDRYSSTPVDVAGLTSGVMMISTGNGHACALMESGGVKCWGANDNGRVGNGTTTTTFQRVPADVVGLPGPQTAVELGGAHTCSLGETGSVLCWGEGRMGQLGDGTWNNYITPNAVLGFGRGAPITTISSAPTGQTRDTTPTFIFSADVAATFECRVDSAAFAACTSPYTAAVLPDGVHRFAVRAADGAGEVGAVASRLFIVQAPAAKLALTLTSRFVQVTTRRLASVRLRCEAAVCEGELVLKAGPVLGRRAFSVAPGEDSVVAVRLTPAAFKRVLQAARLTATCQITWRRTPTETTTASAKVTLLKPR